MSRIEVVARVPVFGRAGVSGRGSTRSRTAFALRLAGVTAYYRADEGTFALSGGRVSSLADLSGNGRTMTQATSARRPTRNASWRNGAPSITFAGGQFLQASGSGITSTNGWTIVFVAQAGNTTSPQCIYNMANAGGVQPGVAINGTGKRDLFLRGNGTFSDGSATISPEVWVVSRGTTNASLAMTINGVSQAIAPNTAMITPSGIATIGAVFTSVTYPFFGDLGELATYNRLLTVQEQDDFVGALRLCYAF